MAEMSKDKNGEQLYNAFVYTINPNFDINKIIAILNSGNVNINWQNPNDGNTPLMEAVIKKDVHVVNLLLQNGADVNIENKGRNTALYYAIFMSSPEIVSMLIDFGANKNIENGETLLNFAEDQLEYSMPNSRARNNLLIIIEILKNKKPNLSAYFWVMCHDGVSVEILQKMLNRKDASGNQLVDINWIHTKDGLTPLHIAAINGNVDIVKFLLEQGADYSYKDGRMHETPVNFAFELEKHEEDETKRERLTKIRQLLEVAAMKADEKVGGRKKTKARKVKGKDKLRKTRKSTKKSRKSYKRR